LKFHSLADPAFAAYGRPLNLDAADLQQVLEHVPIPRDVVYEPVLPEAQACLSCQRIARSVFGEMPMQAGYCAGHNSRMNALEYHKSSEVNLAVTDLVLLLGKQKDLVYRGQAFRYDTAKAEAFFVPRGALFEIYSGVLHYTPCDTGSGFMMAVLLPEGTNLPLHERRDPERFPEDALLFQSNKWLIAHPEAGIAGAYAGLEGRNIEVSGQDLHA
jgi:hypothetical protein